MLLFEKSDTDPYISFTYKYLHKCYLNVVIFVILFNLAKLSWFDKILYTIHELLEILIKIFSCTINILKSTNSSKANLFNIQNTICFFLLITFNIIMTMFLQPFIKFVIIFVPNLYNHQSINNKIKILNRNL